ncbi:MAG: hypothetical protein Q8P42_07595 [Gallionella sp.]|nr:hypothetical protein [Gallionella sp.]
MNHHFGIHPRDTVQAERIGLRLADVLEHGLTLHTRNARDIKRSGVVASILFPASWAHGSFEWATYYAPRL